VKLHEYLLYLACVVNCEVRVDANILWNASGEISFDSLVGFVLLTSKLTAQLNNEL